MSEPSEAPDLDRLLSLLWRRTAPPVPARTGRKPRLGIDDVLTAAMAIADADGLEATSMARVAERLGVATMTLYTYVPSRAALVDLMADEALEQRNLATIGGDPAEWRTRLVRYAHRTKEIYRLHPWLAQVSTARPPLGPGTFREREFVLAAMADAGLPTGQINPAAVAFTMFVTAAARQEAESALLRRATGKSTDAWWQERTSFWENWFDAERHPAMTRIWEAGGYGGGAEEQAAVAFDYGLQKMLDGIATD
ncbi:TetR/AcrR family transcriptional regulator [Actinoplanes sp. RD1]|uniref:TetR/AcrR family transcriptional regulator n=1 Tax=Actinoplanes sp. RD1 TaxID=3064538 RepID=UPI0027427DF8|nr:TetR/AcrR family transcriptional regulator [Actinoplanes sp. RD1]